MGINCLFLLCIFIVLIVLIPITLYVYLYFLDSRKAVMFIIWYETTHCHYHFNSLCNLIQLILNFKCSFHQLYMKTIGISSCVFKYNLQLLMSDNYIDYVSKQAYIQWRVYNTKSLYARSSQCSLVGDQYTLHTYLLRPISQSVSQSVNKFIL